MNNHKILIYDFDILYQTLEELKNEINFEIVNIKNKNSSILNENSDNNSLLVTKQKIPSFKHQLVINDFPIRVNKLIEKFNLCFLKQKFNEQSEFNIGKYLIDLNSREMIFDDIKLKLTEKEVNIIIFLSKLDKPANIHQLQSKVWEYNPELETHTVETHIYRLRKKINETFNDDNFIVSKKNGYQIT